MEDSTSSLPLRAPPGLPLPGPHSRGRSRERTPHSFIPASALGRDFVGAPRPQAIQPADSQFMQLMTQQIELLREQTTLLQQGAARHDIGLQQYRQSQDILKDVDPSLRPVLILWQKQFRKDVEQWATQCDLTLKYSHLASGSELMKPFREESRRQWQLPQTYIAEAKHIPQVDPSMPMDASYNLLESWARLRLKHARECQAFIVAHQGKAKELLEHRVAPRSALQTLSDLWDAWAVQNTHLSGSAKHSSQIMCRQFGEMCIREEIPKAKGKLAAAEDSRAKKHAALLSAEAKYQSMDPQQLFALLALDRHAKVSVHNDGTSSKSVTISKHSELAALIKKFPDLADMYRIKYSDNPSLPKSRIRTKSHSTARSSATSATPKARRSSKIANREKTPFPGKRSSRSTSNRSSQASTTGKGHSQGRGGISKGKGKGKSKGKGRGKGRGRSYGKGKGQQPKTVSFQARN